jgi:RNA polymerase sigma factor (sigma-70 family)
MQPGDTTLGGPRRGFPVTTWEGILRLRKREELAELCRRYWKPIYHHIRVAWRKSNEDAKDLTQAFFLWTLEGDALSKYEPGRGGFRAYVKLLLRHFLVNHEEALSRLKRGGAATFVPIHEEVVPTDDDPDKALDRAWLATVLQRAIDRTRERFRDREAWFRAFEEYEITGGQTYAQIAAKLGMKESDVRNRLFAVREELRRQILEELAETVEGDPLEEYHDLLR